MTYKQAIKNMWRGRCAVYVLEDRRDPQTNLTKQEWAAQLENEPCRLVYKTLRSGASDGFASEPQQVVKLLVSCDASIPSGSRIDVTQSGVTQSYKHAGVAGVYTVHQEFLLEIWGETS